MSIPTDVFLADPECIENMDIVRGPTHGDAVVRCTGLEVIKLAELCTTLGLPTARTTDPVAIGPLGTPVILMIPQPVTDRLAELDDVELERVAAEWLGGPVALTEGEWGEYAVLEALRQLARHRRRRQRLYLWWAPPRISDARL